MIFSRLIPRLQKAVKHPSKAYNYVLWKLKERFLWDYYYKMIREPKIKSFVPVVDYESISRKLKKASINVIDYTIDVTDYYKYINDAEYKKVQKYYGVGGKGDVFSEKSLSIEYDFNNNNFLRVHNTLATVSSKKIRLLGWKEKYSIQEGMKRTVESYL